MTARMRTLANFRSGFRIADRGRAATRWFAKHSGRLSVAKIGAELHDWVGAVRFGVASGRSERSSKYSKGIALASLHGPAFASQRFPRLSCWIQEFGRKSVTV